MSIYKELEASLEEAVEIQKGDKNASRLTYYEVVDVKVVRENLLKVTQEELAATMGVSVDTIKSWESKRRNPSGLAAKVLCAIQKKPHLYKILATY